MATTIRGECVQGSGAMVTALIRLDDGGYLTQADVATITWTLFDADQSPPEESPTYEDESLAASVAVFDDLQEHPTTGRSYNFKHVVPAAALDAANNWRVEYLITPNDGEPFILIALLFTEPTYTD